MPHIVDRLTKTWGTFGKNGDEPLRHILIKDISDSHLENIISFITQRTAWYNRETLELMIEEKQYRLVHSITVSDYKKKKFKFFKK